MNSSAVRLRPLIGLALLILGGLALAVGLPALAAQGADHRDAPLVKLDGRLDINDVYTFRSIANPDNTVLVMTVNPFAGVLSPQSFHPDARYEFLVDDDGDAKAEVKYRIQFDDTGTSQVMHVRGATYGNGSTGSDVSLSNGGVARAGLFDDPFFFDLDAFSGAGGRSFCDGNEVDAFAGANVSAIILEVPSSDFGSENIGVSARVLLKGAQVDRMGRPAINTVFISGDINKDLFNFTVPKKDPKIWGDDVVAALMGFGNDEATANSLASVLLPDLLTFDTTSSAGFLNGRRLPDDVIDAELALITGGALTGDCVDSNDTGFMTSFPYMGIPH